MPYGPSCVEDPEELLIDTIYLTRLACMTLGLRLDGQYQYDGLMRFIDGKKRQARAITSKTLLSN